MDNLPPPPPNCSTIDAKDLPDYYMGKLIVYEPLADNSCKYVVYDGLNRVRCISKASAIDYINSRSINTDHDCVRLAARARYHCNKACTLLEDAASFATAEDRMLLEYLSVQFKPILVNIDNFLTYIQNEKLPYNENEHQT